MKQFLKTFISGIFAGALIGLGGFASLISTVKLAMPALGAVFFPIGLITICFLSLNLFTGKVGFTFEENKQYALDVVIMAVGNMIGAAIIGLLFNLVCPFSYEQLNGFIAGKVLAEDMSNWYIPLIRGVFAGFFVFIAVLLYKKVENPVVKALGILLSIAVMVLVGADHSVANCFYFFAAMKGINVAWYNVLVSLLMAVVGNILGAWFLWVLYHFATKKAQNEEKNL